MDRLSDENKHDDAEPTTSFLDLHLTILPHNLIFLRLTQAHLSNNLHAILHSMLYGNNKLNASNEFGRFFSYTETPEEISIVADSASEIIEHLAENTNYQLSEDKWRAIQLMEGSVNSMAEFTVQTGLVTTVSKVLAQNNIPIFYVSTFQTDYVLVKQQHLNKALKVLESQFNNDNHTETQNIVEDNVDLKHNEAVVDVEDKDNELEANGHTAATVATNYSQSDTNQLKLQIVPNTLHLLSISAADSLPLLRSLIQVLFYPNNSTSNSTPPRFINYTEIENTISLIVDAESLALLQNIGNYEVRLSSAGSWRLFTVSGTFGFDDIGMVYRISTPLTQAKICPFYLSLYSTDCVMVQTKNFEQAKDIFQNKSALA
jgi:hypothetical protein